MADLSPEYALTILGPAFIAGLLVLCSHVSLGRQVLRRGIIFIDLAVAQAAATGAILASMLFDSEHAGLQQLVAGAAALVMVTALHSLERRSPEIQEPLIGGSFVVLASLAILITASDPHGGEHLSSLVAGQILWASTEQLVWLAIATALSMIAMRTIKHPLGNFYIPFAIAITAAVQVVGVYLVFASLIFPALGARKLPGRRCTIVAFISGAAGYLSGLLISLFADLPTGPTVVLTLAISAMFTAFLIRLRTVREHPLQSPHT